MNVCASSIRWKYKAHVGPASPSMRRWAKPSRPNWESSQSGTSESGPLGGFGSSLTRMRMGNSRPSRVRRGLLRDLKRPTCVDVDRRPRSPPRSRAGVPRRRPGRAGTPGGGPSGRWCWPADLRASYPQEREPGIGRIATKASRKPGLAIPESTSGRTRADSLRAVGARRSFLAHSHFSSRQDHCAAAEKAAGSPEAMPHLCPNLSGLVLTIINDLPLSMQPRPAAR